MCADQSPHELGRLVVVEGPDGSGKSTVARALTAHLIQAGYAAESLSFPGSEPGTLGAQIYEMHHQSRDVLPIHPVSLQVLHVAAHIDAIEGRILPKLRLGINVVLDRYWWSTWVYGIAAGADRASLRAMIELEKLHWRAVRPAVAFLVARRDGRQPLDPKIRRRLTTEYKRLGETERNAYPVRIVTNNKSLSECVNSMISHLRSTGWSIPAISTQPRKVSARQGQLQFLKAGYAEGPTVFSRLTPAKPTIVYDTYWRFAYERQNIFFARWQNKPWPWTEDMILRDYKFTNAYRASDRVSQYLMHDVIYKGDMSCDEVFFRTLLFKTFNRIETWELLRREFGELTYREFSLERYDHILAAAMNRGERIYSAAYIMPSGGRSAPTGHKHSMHLRLIEEMMKAHLPEKIASAPSMGKAFELLRSFPTIGDFLAYQYVTDLNYAPHPIFSEMEFVVPGPGALSGIHKCFSDLGGLTEAEMIRVVADRQALEFDRLGLKFKDLWGRPLQLIDCQNLFCEVDKYSRIKHPEFNGTSKRQRIKQRFRPNSTKLPLWYSPKWGLNELISAEH
ncbi:MAG: putative DNA base hypermodification protein [Opitutaceae bacterium]|nr:putative DNA base hypermodification protein [Opitutaceae bacterium]